MLRIVCDGAVLRQAVGTHGSLGGTRDGTAGGKGRRGDGRYEKRDDRYQAIVPQAIPGGLGGARTRVLQLAKLLLPRLSY